jgi:hypothetical protein
MSSWDMDVYNHVVIGIVTLYVIYSSSSLVFVNPPEDTIVSESSSSSRLCGDTNLLLDNSEQLLSTFIASSLELDDNRIQLQVG